MRVLCIVGYMEIKQHGDQAHELDAEEADAQRGAELTERWDDARDETDEQRRMFRELQDRLSERRAALEAAVMRERLAFTAWDAWQRSPDPSA